MNAAAEVRLTLDELGAMIDDPTRDDRYLKSRLGPYIRDWLEQRGKGA